MNREHGSTLMEAVIASAVFVILASAGLVGTRAHLHEVGRAFDRLAAEKAAATRLEERSARPDQLAPGERGFPVDLPGAVGFERVTERESGLFEVFVRVTGEDPAVRIELTTLVVREDSR